MKCSQVLLKRSQRAYTGDATPSIGDGLNPLSPRVTGWWFQPSEKYEIVSWDDEIPN